MRTSLRSALLVAATSVLVSASVACGNDDDPTTTTSATTTSAASPADADADADGATGDGSDSAATDDGNCPPATLITVTTAAGTTSIDAATSYIDVLGDNESATGPQSATLTFASYAIPVDEARGILMPTLGGDQVLATVSIENTAGPIAAGENYVDQTDHPESPTQVNSFQLYTAAGRSLPTEDHEVTFTEVTADHACGTVIPIGTEQDRVEVLFVAERIDA